MQVEVALSVATRGFDQLYSYNIPTRLALDISVGALIKVPFGHGNRVIEGIVMNICHENKQREFELKNIISVVDSIPLNSIQLELVAWMKERYICTLFEAARCMSPSYAAESSKTVKIASLGMDKEHVEKDIDNLIVNKLQHLKVLELLLDNTEMAVSLLMSSACVSNSVINTLVKKGYVILKNVKIKSSVTPERGMKGQAKEPFNTTDEQANVLSQIGQAISENIFKEFLLHGVTGSGKTEVYLQLIHEIISKGKSAIVLVPEISLTPLMIGRFEARFPGKTAVLHSRMTPSQKRSNWRRIFNQDAMVVVGARSAIFAPISDLGIVVIDEEHETTYKSETKPKYDAIEVARFLCDKHSGVLVLGSATPSIETYYRAINSDMQLLTMKSRTNSNGMPDITIVDMRAELDEGNKSIFSRLLKNEINKNIQDKMQTMLFLNRRGHSSFVICRDCGFVVKCKDCTVSMTYHKKTNKLICHYCGRLEKNPDICPACNSSRIRFFGTGTQKIEEEITAQFKNVTSVRMDIDTTTGRGSHQEILSQFEDENINVMIGTQMITKGHDFEKVTLVGVLAADSSLYSPDFRASERTFQQITQVAGRAGRGIYKGRVIIQTYNCDHPTIISASMQNFEQFYNSEILVRKMLKYPPFCEIGCIIIHGINENDIKTISLKVVEDMENDNLKREIDNVEIIGPAPSPSARLRGRNRIRIIVKHPDRKILNSILTSATDAFYSKKHKDIDMSVDINPYNMV